MEHEQPRPARVHERHQVGLRADLQVDIQIHGSEIGVSWLHALVCRTFRLSGRSATGADQLLRLQITNRPIKFLAQRRVPCLRLGDLLEVRFVVIGGPIEEDVRRLATLVDTRKRASAEVDDKSARREWKRGDRDLETPTRLFEIANRVASFDEGPNLGSPTLGGVNEQRVSAQPDVRVPLVPRRLTENRGARSLGR